MIRKNYKFIIITIILVLVLTLSSCSAKNLYEAKKSNGYDINNTYDILKYVSENYPNRTRGGAGEALFVEYIKSEMESCNFDVTLQEFVTSNVKTNNIICKKNVEQPKANILIGLQWDNCCELYKDNSPDGAYESGAAIAVALTFANAVKNIDLDFNLTIIYFSDCVNNWYGAEYYLNKLNLNELNDIDLMINLSMLGSGDSIYMYSRDFDTSYNNYFYSVSKINDLNIKNVPLDKRVIPSSFSDTSPYSYSHIGMMGCNYPFMNKNIPSVSYLSINWEDKSNPTYTEMKSKPNIFETKDDTLKNMEERVGKDYIKNNLDTVVNSILFTLVDNTEGLINSLPEERENNWPISDTVSFVTNIVLKIVIVGLILMLFIMIRQYVKKNGEKYKKEIEKANVIQKQFDSDIFNNNNIEKNNEFSNDIKKSESKDPFDDIFE